MIDCIDALVSFTNLSWVKVDAFEILLVAASGYFEKDFVLSNQLFICGLTVHAGRKNVKYASDKIVLIPTDEFAVLEDKFIKKSILIHGNLPLKVDDLKDIPSDQGDGVFA